MGDADRLQKALLNLISNALRHTRRGEVRVSLRLRAVTDDVADVRFIVRDTGSRIGRPDRDLTQTLRVDRLSDQMGDDPNLALALALRLTELVGGRLHLQTASGLGSSYSLSIRLPLVKPEDMPPEEPKADTQVLSNPAEAVFRGQRILVIDDHPVNRLILAAPLEQLGATICASPAARTGCQAIFRPAAR